MNESKFFEVEQHGLDAVPPGERNKAWWDLFFIRGGSHMTLPIFLVGSLFVADFTWAETLFVVVIGNLILVVLDRAIGVIGVDYGIPTSVICRSSFGVPFGVWLPSFSLVVSLLGWFAITTELAGLAVAEIVTDMTGFEVGTLSIALMGLSGAIPAILGFEKIKWLGRLSVPLLLGMVVWMLIRILEKNDFAGIIDYVPSGNKTIATGLDWMIGSLIVGAFYASDFSRYIRSRWDLWIAYLAGVVPVVFLIGVGAISSLATGDWNPINAVQDLGIGLPGLIVIVVASWTTMDTTLYSGGLALNNVFTKLTRWQSTLVLSLIGTMLAVFRVTEHLGDFLHLLSNVFAPMLGIVICDYYLVRKGRIELSSLYKADSQACYYRGVNWVAIASVALGFIAARYTPPNYMSSVTAMVTGFVSFYAGMRVFYPGQFRSRLSLL